MIVSDVKTRRYMHAHWLFSMLKLRASAGFEGQPMILCLDIRPDIFEPLLGDGSVSQLLLNNHDLHPLSIRYDR